MVPTRSVPFTLQRATGNNSSGTDGVFAIEFDSVQPREVENIATGSITLGSYRETFEAPLHVWRRQDYESHWREAVHRILGGAPSTALITELYDPISANFIKWWPAYRFGGEIRFHNQLLLMADLHGPFDLSEVYRHIGPYEQLTEDGEQISEWAVPVRELEDFLRRTAASPDA